jgi:hypothetical protein
MVSFFPFGHRTSSDKVSLSLLWSNNAPLPALTIEFTLASSQIVNLSVEEENVTLNFSIT